MRRLRRIRLSAMMVIVAVVTGLVALASAWHRGHGPVELSRSKYFRTIAEPVVMTKGISWDDGGSTGLRFVDARKVNWEVCLESSLELAEAPGGSKGPHNLTINGFSPDDPGSHRAPISGIDERALLGLLERWSDRGAPVQPGASPRAEGAAFHILKALQRRN